MDGSSLALFEDIYIIISNTSGFIYKVLCDRIIMVTTILYWCSNIMPTLATKVPITLLLSICSLQSDFPVLSTNPLLVNWQEWNGADNYIFILSNLPHSLFKGSICFFLRSSQWRFKVFSLAKLWIFFPCAGYSQSTVPYHKFHIQKKHVSNLNITTLHISRSMGVDFAFDVLF